MIVCVSVGRSAPLEVRERLAPDQKRLLSSRHSGIAELLILSTCHRVELYAVLQDSPTSALLDLLAPEANDLSEITLYEGMPAIEHLFRVTTGLESLVVGEPQIQAQVRRALYDARQAQAIGPTLSMLVSRALKVGRRARKETSLGAIGESLGTATARMLEDRLGGLQGRQGLILGAGVAAEDAAIALRARGASLRIASRNPGHAEALASRLDASTGLVQDLNKLLFDAEFAVVAVSGGELVASRADSQAIFVDLSMPHAIADGLGAIRIDELPPPTGVQVTTGVAEASALIDSEVAELDRWLTSRQDAGAAIRALTAFAGSVVEAEVQRAGGDPDQESRIRATAERVAAKLIHAPLTALRNADANTAAWLAELLDLNSADSGDLG